MSFEKPNEGVNSAGGSVIGSVKKEKLKICVVGDVPGGSGDGAKLLGP